MSGIHETETTYELRVRYSDDKGWQVDDNFGTDFYGFGKTRLEAMNDYAKSLSEWCMDEMQSILYSESDPDS